jgi:hypothetical protein
MKKFYALELCLGNGVVGSRSRISAGAPHAARADSPKVVEITAKRFEFMPNKITLKKGGTSDDSPHQCGRRAWFLPAPSED